MDELTERMVQLYESGLNCTQVAKECGIGINRTKRILREHVVFRQSRRKYTIDEHVFDSIDNELAAYWLGFIYADGCVRKTYLQVCLGRKDRKHLVRLKEFLQSNSPIHDEHYDGPLNHPRSRLTVFSIHFTTRLRELGILPHRPMSADKLFASIPDHLLHHWIRGFFDGDGSATKRKAIWFCGHKDVLEFIRDILTTKAERNPLVPVSKHTVSKGHYYIRYKGYYNAHAVADYMYQDATIWMPRKRKRIESWKEPMPRAERARLKWEKYYGTSPTSG